MITAGELDRMARFERPVVGKDANGAPLQDWQPVGTWAVGARDVPPSRSEMVRNGLQQARQQTVLRMRWRGDITPDMRVVLLGDVETIMQIVGGPAMIGRRDWLELMLERFSTQGA